MNRIIIIFFGCLSLFSTSYAASFDCEKASSSIENKICVNEQLSKLDDRLNLVYKNALDNNSDVKKAELVFEQRGWLKAYRDTCDDEECLGRAYRRRIDNLQPVFQQTESYNDRFSLVTDLKHIDDVKVFFEEQLKFCGTVHVKYCAIILEADFGLGAICDIEIQLGKQIPTMMCGNRMIDQFTLKTGGVFDLKSFIWNNCPGGG